MGDQRTDIDAPEAWVLVVLPSKDKLLIAVTLMSVVDGDVVCEQARKLAALHFRRHEQVVDSRRWQAERWDAITAIDSWVRGHAKPAHPSAPICLETLGALVDRVAAAAAHATWVLCTEEACGDRTHDAWTALARLELKYDELAHQLADGRRRLPRGEV
ncbi:hypothetical protein [Nocardia sp. NPDC052566]|uniref:hypothetical protein n=1 Tax=Nocardia sp. NPDC052566 TaxID=3364330 RepID=UPI0037C759FE